jgi:hypothetical protein
MRYGALDAHSHKKIDDLPETVGDLKTLIRVRLLCMLLTSKY